MRDKGDAAPFPPDQIHGKRVVFTFPVLMLDSPPPGGGSDAVQRILEAMGRTSRKINVLRREGVYIDRKSVSDFFECQ
jgi:hypothetical protein